MKSSFNQEAKKPNDFLNDSFMVIRRIEYETVWLILEKVFVTLSNLRVQVTSYL